MKEEFGLTPSTELSCYIDRLAAYFQSQLASSLVEIYKIGSLGHGGYSAIYSDIDVCLLLSSFAPPDGMAELIAWAKAIDDEYGKKLSVFWGNPEFSWGRLPVIDRVDLLDHGVPVLHGHRPDFRRPAKAEIHQALHRSIEESWKPRIPELQALAHLEAKDRKPYVRAILYAARLIYTWDKLVVGSNDVAVEYLRDIGPAGLDLKPIEMALACRNGKCTAENVFALHADLRRQAEAAIVYITKRPAGA